MFASPVASLSARLAPPSRTGTNAARLAVTGCSDLLHRGVVFPPLTSVRQGSCLLYAGLDCLMLRSMGQGGLCYIANVALQFHQIQLIYLFRISRSVEDERRN